MKRREFLSLAFAPLATPLTMQRDYQKTFTFIYRNRNGPLPAAQPLTITIVDAETIMPVTDSVQVTLLGSSQWFSVAPTAGQTPLNCAVSLTDVVTTLKPGSYKGHIMVSTQDPLIDSPAYILVTLDVLSDGTGHKMGKSFTFQWNEG